MEIVSLAENVYWDPKAVGDWNDFVPKACSPASGRVIVFRLLTCKANPPYPAFGPGWDVRCWKNLLDKEVSC